MDQQIINQTLNQSSTTLRISSEKNTEIVSESPAEKNIAAALASKKICECSDRELDQVIVPAVSALFLKVGKKSIEGEKSLDEKVIYLGLPKELKIQCPAMRLQEIPIAINRGIYKEFGEYYGINIAELVRFCKCHMESETRLNAIKSVLKPIEIPKVKPTPEQHFFLYKNNLIQAFEKSKTGANYEANAPALYDFVNSLGLIIFSTKEKYDIMLDACKVLIHEQKLKLSFLVNDFDRKPLLRIRDILESNVNAGHPTVTPKPIEADIQKLIIAKSKKISLDAFFHEITLNEFDIMDIVESKKGMYLDLYANG